MDYTNLVKSMLKELPELKPAYDEEMEWLEEELPHVLFSWVFNPYLINLLTENKRADQIVTVFNFLEQMAVSPDEKVQEVLVVTVIESLVLERNIIEIAKGYMGEQTKKFCLEVEVSQGWISK